MCRDGDEIILSGDQISRLERSSPLHVAEPDAFRVLITQDFDGVAVEDGDDGSGEVSVGENA